MCLGIGYMCLGIAIGCVFGYYYWVCVWVLLLDIAIGCVWVFLLNIAIGYCYWLCVWVLLLGVCVWVLLCVFGSRSIQILGLGITSVSKCVIYIISLESAGYRPFEVCNTGKCLLCKIMLDKDIYISNTN